MKNDDLFTRTSNLKIDKINNNLLINNDLEARWLGATNIVHLIIFFK